MPDAAPAPPDATTFDAPAADDDWAALERDLGGQYQLVRLLGRGAFGAVYLARERLLHRTVALKVLHGRLAASAEERERLRREARTVAALAHPAIVPVLAYGETAAAAYMAMPYVGGETLADRLRRAAAEGAPGVGGGGRLEPEEARRILAEVADALAYAHALGVLHRDLKPENVLLEPAPGADVGAPPRVRLIDFGVAAFRTRDHGAGARPETWGTPQFMAPEQAFGEPELDPRSELYALGVLGYLLLGGRLPFEASSPTQRLAQQQAGPLRRLGALAPGAPPGLVAAVERCLAFDPADRWPNARDLRDALAAAGAPNVAPNGRSNGARPAARALAALPGTLRDRAANAWAGLREAAAGGGLGADARFALRTFRTAPAFTAGVVLTLALGVGATTAVYGAARALVLRPPPVADARRVMVLQERRTRNTSTDFGAILVPYDRYLRYRTAAPGVVAGFAGQAGRPLSVRVGDAERRRPGPREVPRSALGMVTTGNYFELLGVRPALGRVYTGAWDDGQTAAGGRGAAEPVAVVSDRFWRGALGADPRAVGRIIAVDGREFTVVGVAPPGFQGALGAAFAFDLWVPAAVVRWPAPGTAARGAGPPGVTLGNPSGVALGAPGAAADTAGPDDPQLNVLARLRPGVDTARAHAALRVAAARVYADDPRTRVTDAWVEPLGLVVGDMRRPVERFFGALLALAGAVLLVAATNAAGLLLARATERRREVAARMAVGASRARLVRQLLVEGVLLCAAGGAFGVALAWAVGRGLNAWRVPFSIPVAVDFGLDGRVLAGAAAAVLGTALLAGLVPAWEGTGVSLAAAMRDGGLQGGPRRTRVRNGFVVAQVALSVVLLAVAGLFGRAFQRALAVDPGFRPARLVRAAVDLRPLALDDARGYAFLQTFRARLLARPEVAAASFAVNAPLTGNISSDDVRRPDAPDDPPVSLQMTKADVGFAELFGTRLLAGRAVAPGDGPDAPPVAVVNLALVRRLWPGATPAAALGRPVRRGRQTLTVVGVVAADRTWFLSDTGQAFAFVPLAQRYESPFLYVRARGDGPAATGAALRAAREELAALAPALALHRPALVSADLDFQRVPQRIGAVTVGAFGLLGLALAAAGLYGVVSYGVAQRTREFGVRLALGAPGRQVVGEVVRRALALVGVGVALGLAGALAAGRAVAGFLFGVSPADPVTLAGVPLVLGAVAVLAALGPARRAARADPMTALRDT